MIKRKVKSISLILMLLCTFLLGITSQAAAAQPVLLAQWKQDCYQYQEFGYYTGSSYMKHEFDKYYTDSKRVDNLRYLPLTLNLTSSSTVQFTSGYSRSASAGFTSPINISAQVCQSGSYSYSENLTSGTSWTVNEVGTWRLAGYKMYNVDKYDAYVVRRGPTAFARKWTVYKSGYQVEVSKPYDYYVTPVKVW